jgi:hypothetical protein
MVQVNKKRKVAHPPRPTTSKPPSLPSSFTPPFLPVEVLENIIDKLHADKHTLAQCMRVNTTFNTITAPVLYRTVLFKSGQLTPYAFKVRQSSARWICPDQRANIGHIKNIIVIPRDPTCSEIQSLAKLSKVDSIRLPLQYLDSQMIDDQFLLKYWTYRPEKLVIYCAVTPGGASHLSETLAPVITGFDRLNTFVFLAMPTFQAAQSLWIPSTPTTIQNLERVVYVMWANTPFSFCGMVPPDDPDKKAHRVELPTFCSAIPNLVAQHTNISEIVVVNAGGIHPSAVGLSFSSTRIQRSAAVQK